MGPVVCWRWSVPPTSSGPPPNKQADSIHLLEDVLVTLHQARPELLDPDQMWHALLAHDRDLDGAFVCAVRSTGIYCRPTCPARRPHRSQVQFFRVPEEARKAGFRACLRCHPDRPQTDRDLVLAACRFIEEFVQTDESLPATEQVARSVGSPPPVCRGCSNWKPA